MKKKALLITGDSLYDHHMYAGCRLQPNDSNKLGTRVMTSPGGYFLIADILRQTGFSNSVEIFTQESEPDNQHGYAIWQNHDSVWRVSQKMGYGPKPQHFSMPEETTSAWDGPDCDIAVFDDAALSYRFDRSAWPAFVVNGENRPGLMIAKMSFPAAKGDLWTYLRDNDFTKDMILIVSADDLRRGEVKISQGISWERTIQDLLVELENNAELKDLKRCGHLIISFGSEGALWIKPADTFQDSTVNMIFDPGHLENAWQENINGDILGRSACFTSGIIHGIIHTMGDMDSFKIKKIDLVPAIMSGLSAMRGLFLAGHGPSDTAPVFPFEAIANIISDRSLTAFRSITLPPSVFTVSGNWSLIDGNMPENSGPLYGRARQVALYGPYVLTDIPYGSFGGLDTVDRNEIESLNSIKNLINAYVAKQEQEKPLSIGVFGPPGAGKSFGIKQIAEGILGDEVPILEFNLSQFNEPAMLINAFHQVRDIVLQGKTPVVFWDEFDSKELFWLQYLLAPMQDGAFLEGQISHPIGKCIFVFAGGTSYTMKNFAPVNLLNEKDQFSEERLKDNDDDIKDFKLKKGPDFVSRLHGYLNVLGPNRRQSYKLKTEQWEDDPTDNCFPLRRALLLRVMAGIKKKDQQFDIDFGLLNAFIKTNRYHHGARSMETIIRSTQKNNSSGLLRSSMPPRSQAAIHVDYDAFLKLIEQDKPFKNESDAFAEKIHTFYKNKAIKEKWDVPWAIPYEELTPPLKEDNKAAARRITDIFSLISLQVVDAEESGGDLGINLVKKLVDDNLEVLARAEHELWMKEKIANGWVFGTRNEDDKTHDCLVPYEKLSDKEKNKDRDAVKNYVDLLYANGFKLIYE